MSAMLLLLYLIMEYLLFQGVTSSRETRAVLCRRARTHRGEHMLGSKRRLGIAALLVLALVAAACGSSSKKSSSGGGATSTTASAAKPSGAPIKLGVLTSITGPSVHFAEVPAGAQAAANA